MEIQFGSNLLFSASFLKMCQKFGSKIVLVADLVLENLYAKKLAEFLNADLILISNQKTWQNFEFLTKELLAKRYGRDTLILAFGGGSVTDLVGFVASIYLRGVPLIYLPTTLLAMVDACIGGKTAIDTEFGKNLIGTFYLPKAVVIDIDTLKTLPQEEWIHGKAEIFKMGLIQDPSLLDDFSIMKAIDAKQKIVTLDPFETGIRRILNFGHTVGHALESLYMLPHGKAVAIGCVVESYLSYLLGYLSRQDFEKIALLQPIEKFDLDKNAFFTLLSSDKKKANGQTRFVLIDRIGHAMEFEGQYCQFVPIDILNVGLKLIDAKDSSINISAERISSDSPF